MVSRNVTGRLIAYVLAACAAVAPAGAFAARDTNVVVSAPGPADAGQPVSIQAWVSYTGTVTTAIFPGGSVDFTNNGAAIAACTGLKLTPTQTNGASIATCSAAFSQPGSFTIRANYSGDAGSNPSSGSFSLTVQGGTTVTLAFQSGLAQIGQQLSLAATVSGAAGARPTGTVAFTSNGSAIPGCSAVVIAAAGTATCATAFSTSGTFTIAAAYSGDSANHGNTGSVQLTIDKVYPNAYLSSYVLYVGDGGQYYASYPVTIGAKFAQAPAVAPPTGTATFYDGAKVLATVPVSAGTCDVSGYACAVVVAPSAAVAALSLGVHPIKAVYSGDGNYQGSTSDIHTITISKAPTDAYIAGNPDGSSAPVVAAQPVNLGAAFTAPTNSVLHPTGSITFYDGTKTLASVPMDADGHASLTIPSGTVAALDAGTHTFTASYPGDAYFLGRTSANADRGALTVNVQKALVTLAPASSPFQPGKPVTVAALPVVFSPGMLAPQGTLDFSMGGTPIAGCTGLTAPATGAAKCTFTPAQAGTVNITYSGDANTASASATLALNSSKAQVGFYAESVNATPVLGETITIDVRLFGPAGFPAPTGTVTFTDPSTGSAALGSTAVGSDGHALLVVPGGTLALGDHNITAAYGGDTYYLAGTSLPVPISVKADFTTVVVAAPPARIGQPLNVTAAVAVIRPGTAVAGGTVNFYSAAGGIAASCKPSGQNGQCSATIAGLDTLAPTVNYTGDGATLKSSVAPALSTSRALAGIYISPSSPNPAFGMTVTLDAVLLGAPGIAAPTGAVSFQDNGVALAAVPVGSDGHASLAVPSSAAAALAVGSHKITATYSGDANYSASVPASADVTVTKAVAKLDLAATPAQAGQQVTFKAAVTVLGPETLVSSGTVDFSSGGTPIAGCSAVPVQNGIAQCVTTLSQLGTYTITATYSGPANTTAVSASVQLTVGKLVPGFFLSAYSTTLPYGAGFGIRGLLMGTPMPTGTVTFSDGAATLALVPVGADGAAPLVIPSAGLAPLSVGAHSIAASYGGDSSYQPATAAPLSVTIRRADTTLALYVAPPQINQPVVVKAAVTVVSPGVAAPGGTVDFTSSGAPIAGCTRVALQNGVAFCSATFAQLTNVTVTAAYSGDAFTAPSTYNLPIAVGRAAAGFYVAADTSTAPYGAPLTVSALVEAAAGVPPPGGTVTFSEAGATPATAAIGADGRASIFFPSASLKALAVGPHTITATYSGDANYQASAPATVAVAIAKASTTLAVASTPPQVGQPVTLKGAVTVVAPGSANPAGTIDFTSGGTALKGCTGLALQNGIATCAVSFAQLGTMGIAAAYSGDAQTAGSTASMQLSVGKALAAIYTAADLPNPPYGATVTVNALLQGADGLAPPTGTVAFSDGATTLATVAVGADGRASMAAPSGSLPAFALGSHSIVASYSGDANYQPSVAAALSVVVAKAAVTVAVASTPAQLNQTTTLKAAVVVVSPGVATPSGTLDFTKDGAAIAGCTGLALQSGAALCTITFSQLGDYTIGARYSGDETTSSGAAAMQLAAGKAVAGIYTASAPAAPVFGVPVVARALLLGAAGMPAPTGSVTFSDGGGVLGTAPVGTDGRASWTLAAAAAAGQHVLTANYGGDASYAPAAAMLTVAIGKASTATTLAAPFGMPLTATITIVAPGAGSPGGTVQFFVAGVLAGSAPVALNNGIAAASIPAGPWTGSAWAVYSGDSNFAGSASATVAVSPAAAVSITSDHNPATAGQAVTFTVTVAPASGGISPTGRVQILVDGATFGSAPLVSGAATVAAGAAALSAGSHTVVANYSGDAVYPAASATFVQLVTKTVVGLTLSASPASVVYGQPVTFTAQISGPSGTVQFLDGTTSIGSAPIASAAASLTVANLAAGSHTISARWTDDSGANSAASAPLPLAVAKAQTVTTVASTGLSLAAAVKAVAPGAGTPSGSVKFMSAANNSVFATVALNGGTAVAALPAAGDAIVAVYPGDANFAGSTSLALSPLAAVNAASFSGDDIAPDEMVTLFGTNLAALTAASAPAPAASLGGTTAAVTDAGGIRRAANLLFVSPSQVSIVLPAGIPIGPAVITLTNASGATFAVPATVARVAPGLFTADGTGKGMPVGQTILVHSDGSQGAALDLASGPIDLGAAGDTVYLVLYGTGLRHQAAAAAAFACGSGTLDNLPVAYAGAQGSVAGLDQVNLQLPAALRGAGPVTLKLTVEGADANPVTLTFR